VVSLTRESKVSFIVHDLFLILFQKHKRRQAAMQTSPVYNVRMLGPTLRHRSFPSGHANTAFATAMFLVLMYGGWYWTSFIMASIVAYSRIYMGVHFFLDTLGGALLAIIVVWIFYKALGIRKYLLTSGAQHAT
jgi:undecaprenyl-diphosphatase